jgi:tRNA(fMet)-specific endonuclease VapC
VIAYLNGDQAIANKMKQHLPHIAISALVVGELLYGARNSKRKDKNLENVYQFLRIVQVIDFDLACAEQYSHLRVSLRQKGRPTGANDAIIAAMALAHNAILVTDNTKHFEHIENLEMENWVKRPLKGKSGNETSVPKDDAESIEQ